MGGTYLPGAGNVARAIPLAIPGEQMTMTTTLKKCDQDGCNKTATVATEVAGKSYCGRHWNGAEKASMAGSRRQKAKPPEGDSAALAPAREAKPKREPKPEAKKVRGAAKQHAGRDASCGVAVGETLERKTRDGKSVVTRWDGQAWHYDGNRYSSLSAVARAATGTVWNGKLFFGLIAR